MKINTIQITLIPTTEDETRTSVTITRSPTKEWHAEEGGQMRGMFPSEIRLVSLIQEHIVSKMNQ